MRFGSEPAVAVAWSDGFELKLFATDCFVLKFVRLESFEVLVLALALVIFGKRGALIITKLSL